MEKKQEKNLIQSDKEVILLVQNFFFFGFPDFPSGVAPIDVLTAFNKLQQVGKDWRMYFAHKGIYKTACRHFIRYAVRYYAYHPDSWHVLTEAFCLDALYKARQHWLPEWDTEFFPNTARVEKFYRKAVYPRLQELGHKFSIPHKYDDYRQVM